MGIRRSAHGGMVERKRTRLYLLLAALTDERRVGEAVADATHRLDILPRLPELVAKALDVGVHRPGRDAHVHTPDAVEQGGPGLDAIAVLVERQEQLELEQ